MITVLALFVTLSALGAVVLLNEARSAPVGYEDENGFHLEWRNDNPKAANVSCVWDLGSAHFAM